MLIRVVQAVNDFILPASFSEKTHRGGVWRDFLWVRSDSGEDRSPPVFWSTFRPGFGLTRQEALAFGLAFLWFFL
jgi:hypothetical protein